MSTTHTAVFENAILKSTELKADTKIAVGLDTEQTTKELTVVGDAPEIRIQDKTGSNPEVNQTTLSIVADGGVTHFRAGTSTFDTTETKGDIKFQSSTGDSTHAIITGTGRVGVGTMAPTESLDIVGNINLQKVSNTATIKLDSNVVTEFTRSKKLIKYPRVALTSGASNAYENGYKVTFSNQHGSYQAWEAFDKNPSDTVGWYSNTGDYNGTSGAYIGTIQLASETELGEWIGLEVPTPIKLYDVRIVSQSYSQTTHTIDEFYIYAKKQSGDAWTNLGEFTGIAARQGTPAGVTVNVDSTDYYTFFALVATKRFEVGGTAGVSIRELEYYGVPEYDPEAHGTDVIMRSVPNVPNTDWLEVYWDANDTTSYSGSGTTVTDLSGNGVTGTITGTNGFDAEYNAWVFDGSGDFIESGTLSLSGDATHSISVWFKATTVNSFRTIVNVTNTTTNGGQLTHTGIRIVNGKLNAFFYADDFNSQVDIVENVWYHAVTTYTGGGSNTVNRKMYLNGVQITEFSYDGTTGNNLNLSSPTICLGRDQVRDMNQFAGSIANTRLFNRALTTDEIWQLYAYQKEYFQVSPDVVTFKGGRLGIGTSEPRAVLDVNGTLKINGSFQQISSSAGKVSIMGQLSNTYVSTSSSSPNTIISGLPEDVTFDRLYTAALGARVFMSGANISNVGLLCEAKYINFGQVSASTSSKTVELAYGFYDGTFTKLGALKFGVGGDNRSITVYQSKAQYYTGAVNNYTTVTWTNQGSGPGASTYGVKDLIIFY
jgi:hypothetical protein